MIEMLCCMIVVAHFTAAKGIRHIWTANKSNCMVKVERLNASSASDDITLGYSSGNSSDEY